MIQALRTLQQDIGATIAPTEAGVDAPLTFGNDAIALDAIQSGVVLYDRSHWGRIQVLDSDRLRFLHNQSTNAFQSLQPGQGCDTVFVTSTGRTLDLVTAYVLDDAVLLQVSPNRRKMLLEWMDRFIFFADKVMLKDVTESTTSFSLVGEGSTTLIETLGWGAIANQSPAAHQSFTFNGMTIRVAVGNGLATPGYTLIMDASDAAAAWQGLVEAGAVPMGERVWEQVRVMQGRPVPDHELTEDINPLEAGLWHTISLSKGCYIGQETIARLHTYKGVKQQLWGLKLSAPVAPETTLTIGEERVGTLTSCLETEDGAIGLAYIRTKVAEAGLKVLAGDQQGELVPLPFISHEYL